MCVCVCVYERENWGSKNWVAVKRNIACRYIYKRVLLLQNQNRPDIKPVIYIHIIWCC